MIRAVSFNAVTFAAYGLNVGVDANAALPGPDATAVTLPRGEIAPMALGVVRAARTLTLRANIRDGSQDRFKLLWHTLLGALPDDGEPHTLAVKLDVTGDNLHETDAQLQATFLSWSQPNVNLGLLTFSIADPLWRATSTSTASQALTADGTLALTNTGLASVYPTFTITPTSNTGRAPDETPLIGWKYVRLLPITNTSDQDWHELLIPAWLGDTTALVSGSKALASGADVRVWHRGKVLRRQLQNWNSLATMVLFPLTLKAGKTTTVRLVYGNPQASTSATTDPEYLDLATRGGVRGGYSAADLYATTVVAAAGSTTTVVNVSPSPGWEADRLKGGWAWIVSGLGSSNSGIRRILSNTANTFTVDDPFVTAPDATSTVAIWMSGIAMEGLRPDSATGTTVTDSSKAWGTNQWQGAYAVVESGLGAGQTREVLSNDGTSITVATWTTQPDTTSRLRIIKPGYLQWMVDRTIFETSWRGLWRINNFYSSPELHWFGDKVNFVVAGWDPFVRFLNEDNYAQPPYNDYQAGGGHAENWFPNGRILRQVRQDRHYGNHKEADGFSYTSPLLIDGIRFDYQWKNVGGIGRFVVGVQASGAESYSDLVSNTTTQASLTDVATQWVNLTEYDPMTVAFNVGPADRVLIPNDTDIGNEAEFRTKTRMELWQGTGYLGGRDATYGYYAFGSEIEMYDLNVRLSLNGRIVQVGGAARHVAVPLNKDFVVRCDPDTEDVIAAVYDGASLSERASYAVRFLETSTDLDGNAVERPARRLLALPPGASSIAVAETAIGQITVKADWTRGYLG